MYPIIKNQQLTINRNGDIDDIDVDIAVSG